MEGHSIAIHIHLIPVSLYIDIKEMCASIGVDPLASNKGFWSNMLDIGDFYYELGNNITIINR